MEIAQLEGGKSRESDVAGVRQPFCLPNSYLTNDIRRDGNFVIYGKDGAGAVWATGTNASDRRVDRVALAVDGERGPRFELWNGSKVVWSSAA